ncbi:Type III effector hopF2 [Pseudomonas syringae pv. maculicola]|nr:Type III effector hopF2 [Pseudomonas syringae pv. maculicola]
MRLGDFLEKGGKVYADTSSVIDGGDEASALIVTLPKGQKVPVEIIPTPNDNSNKGRG